MKLVEELKNINPKNPGSWPWLVKISAFVVIFVAVVVAGAVFDWQGQWNDYSQAKAEEGTLKDAFLAKKKEAINLDLIKKQLMETQQSLGALLKQLPNKSEMDALLTDINQAGLGRGLQFDLFKPGKETVTGVLTVQPISIKVAGDYDDLGKFASDISQLPRIVTLDNISINPAKGKLLMTATAKTYRYLDEAELAARRKHSKRKRR